MAGAPAAVLAAPPGASAAAAGAVPGVAVGSLHGHMYVQPAWVSADPIATNDIAHAERVAIVLGPLVLVMCVFLSLSLSLPWVAIKDPSAVGAEIDTAVVARVARHAPQGTVLVLRVVDSLPGR